MLNPFTAQIVMTSCKYINLRFNIYKYEQIDQPRSQTGPVYRMIIIDFFQFNSFYKGNLSNSHFALF